ncbi:MAG: bifunctional chorismate mutase/prephenate dehydrogenase [Phycisphaerae bacterium]|nr:bifunctional chorismate mutase/prephenate dehydrogenase [Phycisphaerae bacterium]
MASKKKDRDTATPHSLAGIRAMIDAVDHDILKLLARRNGLVSEVAQVKRAEAVPIRDMKRERELIADRREYAAGLGLPSDAIEAVYRLVLWASRDRQAALKVELPPDTEPRTVAIIGGKGGMGTCMARMFGELGHAVLVADVDTELTPRAAVAEADVVVISVPIDVTIDVIRELGPLVPETGLLMDVTSIKSGPVEAMLSSSRASVVGTHPLFGPSVHSLQGQRVVLTPARGDAWLDWTRQMFRARGLNVVETTPAGHDRMMAVVQVLSHFATEVLGQTLADLQVPLRETLEFTSPIYLIEMLMAARHFGQSGELYADIQMSNPARTEVTGAFVAAAERLAGLVKKGDRKAFAEAFERVHAYFGDFTTEAMEKSSFLIDRIVERA